MKLTKRIGRIKTSATMAMAARAKTLKAEGIEIISFGLGEPDFETATVAAEAGIAAIRSGETRYTPPAGTDEIKEAIIQKLKRDNALDYTQKEIIVSCGAKHTLYNIAQVLFEKGDEVIIPAPYWVTYPDQISLCGADPVIVQTKEENRFLMTPVELKAAITPQTKGIIFNAPCNPTGSIYSRAEYEAFADVLTETDLCIISDEIYEKFLYDGASHVSIATLSPALKAKTIVVNGVSKAYSMTGWRIGYAAGPEHVIQAMTKLQSQSTSNPTSIAQKASAAALNEGTSFVTDMVQAFSERRTFVVETLNKIPGISCALPPGSFYVFPNVKGLLGLSHAKGQIQNTLDLATFLLEKGGVTTIPGEAFGAPGYLRLSFAASTEVLSRGLEKIQKALSQLS